MKSSFAFIFWGLLLAFLDFSINGFDLLPDALGFGLVAIGAARLSRHSSHFRTASSLCWFLVVAWFVGLFVSGDAAWPFRVLITTISLAMHWTLLGGVIDVATAQSRLDLAQQAASRRMAYVIILGAGMLIGFVANGRQSLLLVLIFVVPAIVVSVMVMYLIYRADRELTV